MSQPIATQLFFTGHNTPLKRYQSYFNETVLVEPEQKVSNENKQTILCHSVGLVKALLWCVENNNISNVKIIAMDPPDLSQVSIKTKIESMIDDKLLKLYKSFLEDDILSKFSEIGIADSSRCGERSFSNSIIVFRNSKNKDHKDMKLYSAIHYYSEDTHYPYMVKKILKNVLAQL